MLARQIYDGREDSADKFDELNALSEVVEIPYCIEYMKLPVPSIAVAVERITTKPKKAPFSLSHDAFLTE